MWWLLLACGGSPTGPAIPVVVGSDPGCDGAAACASACDAGGAIACNRLGLWLHDGMNGAVGDPVEAARRYAQACDLGAGIGCYNLSGQKEGGQGIPADLEEAQALLVRAHAAYRASCDAGGLVWCANLGGLLERGEGVPPDPVGALALFTRACDGGEPSGCLEQASLLADGVGGPVEPEVVDALLLRTCESGYVEACNNFALRVEARGADARAMFVDACDRGAAIACRNVALRTEDPAAALVLLARACDDTDGLDGLACAMAGDLLANTPGSEAEAGPRFERACSVGIGGACLEIVRLASDGHLPLTPDQAIPYLQRGCTLGETDACAVLDTFRSQAPAP